MMLKRFFAFIRTKTGIAALFGAMTLIFALAPLLHCGTDVSAWPYWFHDHFFNAVQISSNLAAQGTASLDGLTETNDLSVLWGGFLALLSLIAEKGSPLYFVSVCLALACMPVFSLFLMNRLLQKLDLPIPAFTLFFVNAFFFVMCLRLAATGVDAAWAVPAVLLAAAAYLNMLEKPSFITGAVCGLSVFLCVLTRFDTLGFVISGAFIFYMQFNGKMPVTLKQTLTFLPGLAVGLLPAVGWEIFIYRRFGTVFPATLLSWMQAQNMSPQKIFSVLLGQPVRHFLSSPMTLIFLSFPFVAVIAAAFDSVPRQARVHTPKDTLFYSLIWFPIVQIPFFAFFTHLNLPEYAYYSLTVALPFALTYGIGRIDARLETDKDRKEFGKYRDIIGGLLLLLGTFAVLSPRSAGLRPFAETVKAFAEGRPGIYALSNGGGLVSFVANVPVVRLDGIASNKEMADLISKQAVLSEAFKRYGADYYVMSDPVKSQGCYAAREPAENGRGGDNKGMSDWLCVEPVARKKISKDGTVALFAIDRAGKAVSK